MTCYFLSTDIDSRGVQQFCLGEEMERDIKHTAVVSERDPDDHDEDDTAEDIHDAEDKHIIIVCASLIRALKYLPSLQIRCVQLHVKTCEVG